MINNLVSKVWQNPWYFIAFGFGSGLQPWMPGTWGTMAGIPIYLILMNSSIYIYSFIVILLFFLGVYCSEKVTIDLGIEDYSGIVIDEIVGLLVTLWGLPANFRWLILGFLLFRLFDIWKPWPISFVESKVKGGLGVMLDDLLAALPACAILHLLDWVL